MSESTRPLPRPRRVFVNPAGQRDNVGDSVLRRPYLDALRRRGELHVLASGEDFSSGLGLRAEDIVYSSRARWFLGAVGSAVRGNLHFAVNAGEVVGTRKEQLRAIWQPVLACLARISGGSVFLAGVAVRPGTDVAKTHLRGLARMATVKTWRDQATVEDVGIGTAQPDWAFALGATANCGSPRKRLAICFRGDRRLPSEAFLRSLREFSDEEQLEPWVVVQVRRDRAAATALQGLIGGQILVWPDHTSHAAQEARLRAFYRECSVVVSDRIHSLIIACTEGATPIGATTSSSAKLSRTFSHVMPLEIIDATLSRSPDEWRRSVESITDLTQGLDGARSKLGEICRAISGGPG